ncbi:MAG: exonuclease SbcCD subunit D [Bacteroidota bacterium]
MRILHTSDWHLGQEFHGFPREHEHASFLGWLEQTLVEQQIDALVVAGDIYDSQNPPISAQRQLYAFIADIRRRLPPLDVVLVGGNHDSAGRLEAPGPLLETFGVRVVGSLPRDGDGAPDPDRVLVPLHDGAGTVAAWCAAVPFLRLSDLPPVPDGVEDDPLIWGVRQVYTQIIAVAEERRLPGQALVVTGHCYMTGCALSELSERRILGGNQHALPVDIFPDGIGYVALGHLHKAQSVGGRDRVRYSGSPLPLSVSERDYRHQVLVVETHGGDTTVTALPVPRPVDIVRVPTRGAATPDDALAALRALDAPADGPSKNWPYLHVAVACPGPLPSLRRDVEEAIAGKGLRLARIDKVDDRQDIASLPPVLPDLEDVAPEEVFVQCWRAAHDGEPPEEYLSAFRSLLEGLDSP